MKPITAQIIMCNLDAPSSFWRGILNGRNIHGVGYLSPINSQSQEEKLARLLIISLLREIADALEGKESFSAHGPFEEPHPSQK